MVYLFALFLLEIICILLNKRKIAVYLMLVILFLYLYVFVSNMTIPLEIKL